METRDQFEKVGVFLHNIRDIRNHRLQKPGAGPESPGQCWSRPNQVDQQDQCEHAAIVWRSGPEGPQEPWDTPGAPTENLTGQGTSGPQTTGLRGPRWLWQCGLAELWHPGASYLPGEKGGWFEQANLILESVKRD